MIVTIGHRKENSMAEKKTWKEIREQLGMTQQELSDKIGITRDLYCMKENYKRPMRLEEALIISQLSGVDLREVRPI